MRYESVGRGFESLPSHQENQYTLCTGFSFCLHDGRGPNKAAAHSAASKATVRLCLARGGQPIGTSTKKDAVIRSGDFLLVAVQGSNSNNDDRGLRPKQRGVVGAAF